MASSASPIAATARLRWLERMKTRRCPSCRPRTVTARMSAVATPRSRQSSTTATAASPSAPQAGEPDDPAVDHRRETQPVVGEQLGDQGWERFRIGARPSEESLLGTQRGGELLAGFDEARVIGGDDEKI